MPESPTDDFETLEDLLGADEAREILGERYDDHLSQGFVVVGFTALGVLVAGVILVIAISRLH